MPTPIGHSLFGWIMYSGLIKKRSNKNWMLLILFIAISNLPDIDYIPGLFINKPNVFHHGFTHTLVFCIFTGMFFAILYRLKKYGKFYEYFLIFSIVCLSHLLLDYFAADSNYPYGEPLYWPISKEYFLSSVSFFRGVYKGATNRLFFQSLFYRYNLITMVTECLIFLPILGLIRIIKHNANYEQIKI